MIPRPDPRRLAGIASTLLAGLLGSRDGRRPAVLVYHRVAGPVPGLPFPDLNVRPSHFRRQITGLLDRGYRIWPLARLLDHAEAGRAVPPRVAVITFDDGFGGVFCHAWPVLRELRAPATVFLNTAYLDGREPFPFDAWGTRWRGRAPVEAYRPLTATECRAMREDGLIELAAHTHTHADFRGRPEALEADLTANVRHLRERFGVERPTFAFPFGRRHLGYVSPELIEAARRAGVRCALTTEARSVTPSTDPFGWGRFNAYDWDTGQTLAARLAGWYGWAPALQEWITSKVEGIP
jgi:peptidoglycan/xylan/chitin deacetylase (PgdA/CDA1 family)